MLEFVHHWGLFLIVATGTIVYAVRYILDCRKEAARRRHEEANRPKSMTGRMMDSQMKWRVQRAGYKRVF